MRRLAIDHFITDPSSGSRSFAPNDPRLPIYYDTSTVSPPLSFSPVGIDQDFPAFFFYASLVKSRVSLGASQKRVSRLMRVPPDIV